MSKLSKIMMTLKVLLSSFCLLAGESEKIPVGGQAVIEGVLMKGPSRWGLSVRQESGNIWTEHWPSFSITSMYPWKAPLLRGVVIMVEMMIVGIKALNRSAELYLGEEEKIKWYEMVLSVSVAVFAVVGLFIAFPVWFSDISAKTFGLSSLWKNILEGIVRGAVFVFYIAVIGLWKDIREVFRYHGAEHKTINAFESGAPMVPESVASFSRIHPRCGTSFLLVVVAVSIVVFSAVGHGSLAWRALSRVVLLPVVIGISYEFIRFCSKSGTLGQYLISPALSLQFLTTREPSIRQIEVAISSLEAALDRPLQGQI